MYASVMSYGFLGDVSKEAEHYRSLGPKRYDYVGVKKFFKNAGYEAEIRILLDKEEEDEDKEDRKCNNKNNNNSNGLAVEGGKCLENCERCAMAISAEDERDSRGIREELKELDNSSQSSSSDEIVAENGGRWKVIRGKFFMVCGANISCACDRSPQGMSPNCHLGDGCLDLILVNHSSFLNNLRLASRLSANGQHIVSIRGRKNWQTVKNICSKLSKNKRIRLL